MDSSMPLGVNGGAIRIGCANDFQASSIKRNRELLNGIVQKVFHARTHIEVEVTPLIQQHPTPQSGTPQSSSTPDEHPVIKAMVRELGAEPVQ
jgi:hypothetical protein